MCEICEEGNQETSEELMECSNCAQIAHPSCLKVQTLLPQQFKTLLKIQINLYGERSDWRLCGMVQLLLI